jgi:hypothetical protein
MKITIPLDDNDNTVFFGPFPFKFASGFSGYTIYKQEDSGVVKLERFIIVRMFSGLKVIIE